MAISFASGFTPILSLKKSKPSFCLRVGLGHVFLGGLVAEEPHRLHAVAARAGDEIDQPLARWRGRSDPAPPSRPPNGRRRCRAARDAAPDAAPASRGRPCRSASARDGRARRRPARPACRRSWSERTPLRPSRRVPSAASIRTSRFCAAVMVSADIFIGVFSGNATGIASMRRIVSGADRVLRRRQRVVRSFRASGLPRSCQHHSKKPAARNAASCAPRCCSAVDDRAGIVPLRRVRTATLQRWPARFCGRL